MCANYAVIDTGFAVKPSPINTTPSGTAFSKVNSGNEILMKGTELGFDCGSNTDDSVVPGQTNSVSGFYEGPEINAVSCIADTYLLTGVANRTISADMTLLLNLKNAVKSKGLKMLYYSSTTDGYRDFTDTWGETTSAYNTNGGFTSGTTPVLFVHCIKLSIRNTSNSKLLRYTLNMIESTS